jgi:hypothetical protein
MKKLVLRSKKAFSLVEATLALGICAFCLLAIFSLLPVGIKSSKTAMEQTAAVGLLSMVAADLRETSRQDNISTFFQIPMPESPVTVSPSPTVRFFRETGECFTDLQADSRYRLTVTFLRNGSYPEVATMADVQVTWPAMAVPASAAGRVRTLVAGDRN